MTTLAIVGSRTYQPLGDVTRYVARLPKQTVLICPGASPVVLLAAEIATARGLTVESIPLDPRRPFLDRIDGLVVFAATDPATKRITDGTAGLITQAESLGVPLDLHHAPCSGRLCQLLTTYQAQRAKVEAIPASQGRRRAGMVRRLYALGAELVDERDRLADKLERGWEVLGAGRQATDQADDHPERRQWEKWLAGYEAIADALQDGLEAAA